MPEFNSSRSPEPSESPPNNGGAAALSRLAVMLRELRNQSGLSLSELNKKVGVSRAYLSALENGRNSKPSGEVCAKLAAFYRIDPLALVGEAVTDRADPVVDDYSFLTLARQLTYKQRQQIVELMKSLAEGNIRPLPV